MCSILLMYIYPESENNPNALCVNAFNADAYLMS